MKTRDRCIRLLIVFSLCITLANNVDAASTRTLVLATSVHSPIHTLSAVDARKVYLGINITIDNKTIRPLLNATDSDIERVFLQKIIFMSERTYERRIITNVYRRGSVRPDKFVNIKSLLDELTSFPNTLTYLWKDQIQDNNEIRILGELWTGRIE